MMSRPHLLHDVTYIERGCATVPRSPWPPPPGHAAGDGAQWLVTHHSQLCQDLRLHLQGVNTKPVCLIADSAAQGRVQWNCKAASVVLAEHAVSFIQA